MHEAVISSYNHRCVVLLCYTPTENSTRTRQTRGWHGTTGRGRGPIHPSGGGDHRRAPVPCRRHARGALRPPSVGAEPRHHVPLPVHVGAQRCLHQSLSGPNHARPGSSCALGYALGCADTWSRWAICRGGVPVRRSDRSCRRCATAGRRPRTHAEHRSAIPLVDGPATGFFGHRPDAGLAAQTRASQGCGRCQRWRWPGFAGSATGVPAPRPAGVWPGPETSMIRNGPVLAFGGWRRRYLAPAHR